MSRRPLQKTLVLACLSLGIACAHAASFKAIAERDGGRDAGVSFNDLAKAPEHAVGPTLEAGRSFSERGLADDVVPGWTKEDDHDVGHKQARPLPHHRHAEVGNVDVPPVTAPIPEPSTYAMMAAGLIGMGFIVRRRRLRQA